MEPWKTLDRTVILDHSKYLQVEDHVIELPDGTIITNWAWLNLPSYAIVIARDKNAKFLVFRQTKYAVKGVTLAPVGGHLDEGEEPLIAAKRELLEETGYTAADWYHLGSFVVNANRGSGTAHLYFADQAEWIQEADADDLEEQELLLYSQKEVEKALMENKFQVLGWTAAFAQAILYLKSLEEK